LHPHGAGSPFHVSQRDLGIRCIGRIDQRCNTSGRRHQLTKEFKLFRCQLEIEKIDTCQVAARPGENYG
jgi:hypothetical protein